VFQPNQPGSPYGQPGDNRGVVINGQVQPAVQTAFLTQAFFWMFAGLLVTAAVAANFFDQNFSMRFTGRNYILLFIGQIALAIGIQWGIRRINATLALGLFFVYAATLGLTIGLIVTF